MNHNTTLDQKIEELLDKLEKESSENNNRRMDSWIIRLSGVMITTVCLLVISFMITMSERVTVLEHDKLNAKLAFDSFLTINSYGVIENKRASDLIEFISFIGREANIKEEELEQARTLAIRQLSTVVSIGTTRSRGN